MRFKLFEDIAGVKAKYPKIPDEIFMKLISLDPTFNPDRDSVGTYGKWLLNLYNKGNLKEEDFYKVPEYLNDFEAKKKMFSNKDIGQFKTLGELASALENVDDSNLSDRQKLRQKQNARKHSDLGTEAELIYEDSNWEIWIPKTYEASCKLGNGSHWCTATTENDYYYNQYTELGKLYINLNKKDPDEMYQFHFETGSFMDKYDEEIDLIPFLNSSGLLPVYGKILKEKYREDHSNGSIVVTLTEDDVGYIFSEASGGYYGRNDSLGGETCTAAFFEDQDYFFDNWYSDYSYIDSSYDIDYIEEDQYLENAVEKIGITMEQLHEIASGDFDAEDYEDLDIDVDDIRTCVVRAYSEGNTVGSINECCSQVQETFEDWVSDSNATIENVDYGDRTVTIKEEVLSDEELEEMSDEQFIKFCVFDEDPGMEDYSNDHEKNSLMGKIIGNGSSIYEPYYGYDDTDTEVYNDMLYQELHELY